MEKSLAVAALAALAQDNRLDVFRLLVQAGQAGLAAGRIAEKLGVANTTLSFHLDRLHTAGLVTSQRNGRSIVYAANYPVMTALLAYLTENCCQGRPELCAPAPCKPQAKPAMTTAKRTMRSAS